MRASPLDRFFTVAVPLARPGFVTAAVLGFAHTVGEFGVVLMIGGNIPGRTQVLSIAIYDHVDAGHFLSLEHDACGVNQALLRWHGNQPIRNWIGPNDRRANWGSRHAIPLGC